MATGFHIIIAIAKIATLADKGKLTMVVSALSYSTVNYFLCKFSNHDQAVESLKKFKIISETCPLDETIIDKGLHSDFHDFEDALKYFSAMKSDCNVIITRNGKDFKLSEIPVMTPDEYLLSISKKQGS